MHSSKCPNHRGARSRCSASRKFREAMIAGLQICKVMEGSRVHPEPAGKGPLACAAGQPRPAVGRSASKTHDVAIVYPYVQSRPARMARSNLARAARKANHTSKPGQPRQAADVLNIMREGPWAKNNCTWRTDVL